MFGGGAGRTTGGLTQRDHARPARSAPLAQTPAQYALAFIVAMAMGTLRHVLPHWRARLAASCRLAAAAAASRSTAPAEYHVPILPKAPAVAASPTFAVVADTLLYAAAVLMGFLNMLVVMTYNPGLLVAVVMGEVIGLLAWSTSLHCGRHGERTTQSPHSPRGDGDVDVEIGGSACH